MYVGTMTTQPNSRHASTHRRLLAAYGFGLFPLAVYQDAMIGNARIIRHLPSLADGYLSGATVEADRHVLYVDGKAWMSTGLMEQESHAFHVHEAHGSVIVAGLGMGLYAYAASLKPEVDHVMVVERRADVIAVMKMAADFGHWPGGNKITVIEADALGSDLAARVNAVTDGRPPDYLFADIWPTCCAPNASRETAAMVRALRPSAAGWWGQELSFGLWCRDQARQPDHAAFTEYFGSIGVPARGLPGYCAFCADVIVANLPSAASRFPNWRQRLRGLLGMPSS